MKKVINTEKDPKHDWLFGQNPNAIEAQEAEGQVGLVNSLQLPKKCNSPSGVNATWQYSKMGIKVFTSSKGDDLFMGVKLPDGWKKESTDHSMWSNLLDDKGRVRATLFYKASFYDRDAFINFNRFISFRVDRLAFLENDYTYIDGECVGRKTPYVGRVTDVNGNVLFETEHIQCDEEFVDYKGNKAYSERYKTKLEITETELKDSCLNFLKEKYPDYLDLNAYWD